MDLLAIFSLSFFCITIYDRILFYLVSELTYQFLFKSISNTGLSSKSTFQGNLLWFFIWIYIGADFLYKSNGYYYDWRNRIRLWKKFDLTGLYKGFYQIFSFFLASINLNLLILKHSKQKSKEKQNIFKNLKNQKIYFFVGLSLLLGFKYILATFSYMDEVNMFRAKVLENVVISHAFLLFLIP
jgi:hypothetical protein